MKTKANPTRARAIALTVLLWVTLLPCLAQGVVTNTRSGVTHTTIQAAIDAAMVGDILEIDAGSWPETLHIGKNLTLIGKGTGFRLQPDIDLLSEDDNVIHIGFWATVSIANIRVEGIREAEGDPIRGVKSIIMNNGYLRLVDADIIDNRTVRGAIVNKSDGAVHESGELFTDSVDIGNNLGDLAGPGGGVKNHGRWEGMGTNIYENDGLYGGLFNKGGEVYLSGSSVFTGNTGDYGAFYNDTRTRHGAVLGFLVMVYDNFGAIASDFRDPNRGDYYDPSLMETGDCETVTTPTSVNPCGEYDSPLGTSINGPRGLYWL